MAIGFIMLVSCRETVDTSARYVFTENTVMSYLEKHSADYGTYVDILHRVPVSTASRTTLAQLMSARGHYTVFAPTNEAIRQYLDTLVERQVIDRPSWEAFTDSAVLDSVRRVIAYNSIIDCGDYDEPLNTYDFPMVQGGEVSIPNLYDRKLTFYYDRRNPEAITNDIRLNGNADDRRKYVYAPNDKIYHYLVNLCQTDDTYTCFFDYGASNPSNMADEIKVDGRYDITIKLPPVPKSGTYELRYAIVTTSYRGVCQIYLSKDLQNRTVTGIPTDMRISVKSLGAWEPDTEDQDYNAEVDKRLRSIGYMKGCQHTGANGNIALSMRQNNDSYFTCMCQIISRRQMSPDETYYLTFKNVMDAPKELYLDYFEFCAKEVYDNPETPEDIW